MLRRHPVEVPGVLADPAVISALLAEIDTLAAAAEQLVPARDAAVEAAAHAEITDTFGYDVPARIHALAADPSVERRAHDATELSRELQQHLMVEKRIRKHAGYALHERDGVPWRVVQELAGVWHNAIVWARTRMPADALRGLREDAEALVRLSRVKIELYQAWDQHVREQVRDPAVQELAEVHNPATVSAISGIRSNHLSAILHPKPRRKVA